MGEYATDLKMPSGYVDMSLNDMEYDGGFSWKTFSEVLIIAGAAAFIGGAAVGGLAPGLASTIGCYVAGTGFVTMAGGGIADALITKHQNDARFKH